jgi:uncharacterized protein YjiS (DUF1127 family)
MIRATNTVNSNSRPTSVSLWARVLIWHRILRERRALSKLEAHLLRDIGLSDNAAESEAERKFWDVPAHWHNRR